MSFEKTVLIIEDDQEQGKLLASFLQSRQYDVTHVTNGRDALILSGPFQFILLDLNLPDTDGIALFSPLKSTFENAFVIMLTARKEEVDRVLGLEVGADDYLTKPYSLRELEARMRAILRRHSKPVDSLNLHKEGFQLHPETCQARFQGQTVEFTAQEFKVLEFLAKHPKHIYSRDQIIDRCWGTDVYVTDRVVDAMIARIRKKLKSEFNIAFIFTKHGMGYGFHDET